MTETLERDTFFRPASSVSFGEVGKAHLYSQEDYGQGKH